MTDQEYRYDLDFLYDALCHHPMMLDEGKKNEFEQLYYREKEKQFWDYGNFIHGASKLTTYFGDGHTNIEIPYTQNDRCIALRCMWDEEENRRLILCGQYDDVPANAEIIAICGEKVENVVQRMAERIPHENIYLVKSRMVNYPYQNYHVFSEMNMKFLYGERERYDVSFLAEDKVITKECLPVYYDGTVDFADEGNFVSYEISGDSVIMHLDSCLWNEKYRMTLDEIAEVCEKHHVKALVLDLSRNMGGNSAVIDEFIKYTNVESYKRYEMIDYSSGKAKYITYRDEVIANGKKTICFPDQIYCKVSCHTFSSARTFAVTLKDNGIARVIGTPTGGKPDSYGMPRKLKLPNSGIRFRVSTSCFLRPDKNKDNEEALFPDE